MKLTKYFRKTDDIRFSSTVDGRRAICSIIASPRRVTKSDPCTAPTYKKQLPYFTYRKNNLITKFYVPVKLYCLP